LRHACRRAADIRRRALCAHARRRQPLRFFADFDLFSFLLLYDAAGAIRCLICRRELRHARQLPEACLSTRLIYAAARQRAPVIRCRYALMPLFAAAFRAAADSQAIPPACRRAYRQRRHASCFDVAMLCRDAMLPARFV